MLHIWVCPAPCIECQMAGEGGGRAPLPLTGGAAGHGLCWAQAFSCHESTSSCKQHNFSHME